MSVPIVPAEGYVVAQKEAPQTRTAAGIYIPESAAEKTKIATVLSVGEDVKKYKKGDKVLYKGEYATHDFKLGGEEYLLIEVKEIVGKLR